MKKTHLFSSDYLYSLINKNASHFVILSWQITLLICSGLDTKREIFVQKQTNLKLLADVDQEVLTLKVTSSNTTIGLLLD